LNSAVAAYYYLRLLVVMYMNEPGEAVDNIEPLTPGLRAALILPAIGTLVLGILPGAILNFAQNSTLPGASKPNQAEPVRILTLAGDAQRL